MNDPGSITVSSLKAVILDFDGVILESNHLKGEAFGQLFSEYPSQVSNIVQLHKFHGGMSRYEKFRIIYRDFLQKDLGEDEMNRLDKEFRELVQDGIMACIFVPGAFEFLNKYHHHFDLFIASGTPEEELREVVRRRNMSQLFSGIYGAPDRKGKIMEQIMRLNGWQPEQMLFVGDAIDDYSAAQETRVPFIGRVPRGEGNPFPEVGVVKIISDLHELNQIVRSWRI